jgi:large subunit ribosomal protein L22
MKVTATLTNVHVSPRKARLVAGLIRGLHVAEAEIQLQKTVKKTSDPLLKLLKSAIANAENNFSLATETLWVARVDVNEGQKLKRFMPRAQGRATPLWRRLSRVTVVLESREAAAPTKKVVAKKEVQEPVVKKAVKKSVSGTAKKTVARKRAKTEQSQ